MAGVLQWRPSIRGSDNDWCEGEGEVAKRGFLSGLTTITIGVDDVVLCGCRTDAGGD